MKRLSFSFGILILVFIWIYHTAATDYNPSINPIIGDISYVKKFGHLPAPGTDKTLRIKTHLEYSEMILRNEETPYLTKLKQAKRQNLLNDLHSYWVAGKFPINYGHNDEHVRCMTAVEGKLCAIGYLFERSVDRQLSQHQKETTNRKTEPTQALNAWILESGLTREEAALIQPVYQ